MFKHERREQTTHTKSEDWYTGQINGYDVMVISSEDGTRLSIYKTEGDGLRLGIIECRPKSVEALEAFAEQAGDLFSQVAQELRSLGKDDLRSGIEQRQERLIKHLREYPHPHSSDCVECRY